MPLQDEIDRFEWFHAIDFGEACSRGRSSPPNWSLYATLDHLSSLSLAGASCLDLGTMDGLAAFSCHELGADEVVATDLFERPQFEMARAILGYPVRYLPNTHIDQFHEIFAPAQFDLIVYAGVLYHVASPLSTLLICRHHLKTDGYIIVETVVAPGEDPILHVNPVIDPPIVAEYTTYFVPTVSAVEAMMMLAGFQTVATSLSTNRKRVTVLGRASTLDDIPGRPPFMVSVHDRLGRAGQAMMSELDYGGLGHPERPRSAVTYDGFTGERVIDNASFVSPLKHQPTAERLADLADRPG